MSQGLMIRMEFRGWECGSSPDIFQGLGKIQGVGDVCLVPPAVFNKLKKIRVAARQELALHTIKTSRGLFMPQSAYPHWAEKLQGLRSDLEKMYGVLAESVGELRSIASDASVKVASDLWKSAHPEDGGSPPGAYAESVRRIVVGEIPPSHDIRKSEGIACTYYPHPILVANSGLLATVPIPDAFSLGEGYQESEAWSFIDDVVAGHAKSTAALCGSIIAKKIVGRWSSITDGRNIDRHIMTCAYGHEKMISALSCALECLTRPENNAVDAARAKDALAEASRCADEVSTARMFLEWSKKCEKEQKTDDGARLERTAAAVD